MRFIVNVWSWLQNVIRWLSEPSSLYQVVLGILLATTVSYYFKGTLRESLAMGGILLQLSGTVCVGKVLVRRIRRFQGGDLVQELKDWLKRFPQLPGGTVQGQSPEISTEVTSFSDKSDLTATPPDAPLEDRVCVLESNQALLQKRILKAQQGRREEANALRHLVREHRKQVETWIKGLEQLIEASAVGDAKLELVGFVWLITGLGMGAVVRLLS